MMGRSICVSILEPCQLELSAVTRPEGWAGGQLLFARNAAQSTDERQGRRAVLLCTCELNLGAMGGTWDRCGKRTLRAIGMASANAQSGYILLG